MHVIFVIDCNTVEHMFVMSYVVGQESWILGELLRLSDLCHAMGYDFSYIEVSKDPKPLLFRDNNNIYRYDTFADALHQLNIKLDPNKLSELGLQDKEVYNVVTERTKEEILYLMNKEEREKYKLLKKLFFK